MSSQYCQYDMTNRRMAYVQLVMTSSVPNIMSGVVAMLTDVSSHATNPYDVGAMSSSCVSINSRIIQYLACMYYLLANVIIAAMWRNQWLTNNSAIVMYQSLRVWH